MKKILSIDDEPSVLQFLRTALSRAGYGVETSSDPLQAPALVEKLSPDLLILDVMMPARDGKKVFEEIKATGRPLPILFATAWQEAFTMDSTDNVRLWQEQMTDGLTDIIYKPFRVDVLLAKVEGLIGPADDADPA